MKHLLAVEVHDKTYSKQIEHQSGIPRNDLPISPNVSQRSTNKDGCHLVMRNLDGHRHRNQGAKGDNPPVPQMVHCPLSPKNSPKSVCYFLMPTGAPKFLPLCDWLPFAGHKFASNPIFAQSVQHSKSCCYTTVDG